MSIDIEEAGSPRRKTRESSKDSGGSDTSSDSSSGCRKSRISVTPRDPAKLEEVAGQLGLPKSKVYNMGFRALLEKLGLD